MKPLLAVALAFMVACATTHPGEMANPLSGGADQPIKISAEKQSDFSDAHYTFVTFTVESLGDDMVRVKHTDLEFPGSQPGTYGVLVGNDLEAWADAHEEEAKKAEQNRHWAQIGLMLGGLALSLAGSANHNNTLTAVGAGAAVGGAGWSLASSIHQSILKAHNPAQVPTEHVYAPFAIPAGLFVRKWAVIQHPKGVKLRNLNLSVTLEDGSEAVYAVHLK